MFSSLRTCYWRLRFTLSFSDGMVWRVAFPFPTALIGVWSFVLQTLEFVLEPHRSRRYTLDPKVMFIFALACAFGGTDGTVFWFLGSFR
jgi:hypothetical protein